MEAGEGRGKTHTAQQFLISPSLCCQSVLHPRKSFLERGPGQCSATGTWQGPLPRGTWTGRGRGLSASRHNRISGYRSLRWTEMAVQGLRGEKRGPCPPLPSSRVSSVPGRHSLAGARSCRPGSGDCPCVVYSQSSPGQAREGLQIRVTGL